MARDNVVGVPGPPLGSSKKHSLLLLGLLIAGVAILSWFALTEEDSSHNRPQPVNPRAVSSDKAPAP